MDNIFDSYTAGQIRQIFLDKTNEWPEDYRKYIHEQIAYDLLNSWLESIDDDTYDERVRGLIETLTYGYEDDDGNEMLEFDVENKT